MNTAYTLAQLAEHLGAVLVGDGSHVIHGVATLSTANTKCVSFLANPAYQKYLATTHAGAVIITHNLAASFAGNKLLIDHPYLAYAKVSNLFDTRPKGALGIHPAAVVHATAVLGQDVSIAANSVIGAEVVLGDGVEIGPGVSIGEGCSIGAHTRLAANVVLYHQVIMGSNCIVHSGAVIGADGFGFAREGKQWIKIQQLGRVIIGDRVEIGANTAIDRGALGDTVLDDGVKLDNLIQIGHNVRLGKNTAIAALSGVAGSVIIGENCTIAGGVGIAGHLELTNDVHITAMSMVSKSIVEPGSYSSGTPLTGTREWRKNAVRFRQLDNLVTRVKKLEQSTSSN